MKIVSFTMSVAEQVQSEFVQKMAVAQLQHKHSLRYQQWKMVKESLERPIILLLAGHNSIVLNGNDAQGPWKFEQRVAHYKRESQALSGCNMVDLRLKVHHRDLICRRTPIGDI